MSDSAAAPLEVHISVLLPEQSAVDVLQSASELSRQRIKFAMNQGAVWITRGRNTQRLRRAKRMLRKRDEVHLYYDAKILAEEPAAAILVADLGAYSVWNKPCGLRSQGSKWGDHCTMSRWAERHLQPERSAFVVHRLDRAANGLMLIAHTKTMAATLSGMFEKREIEKHYRALVHGDFSQQASPQRVELEVDGKTALSEVVFDSLQASGTQSLLDVRIESGRKHQIRRHLSALGFPIVGDRLYGDAAADAVDLQLSAYRLAFHCPVGDAPVEYRLTETDQRQPDAGGPQ